MESRLSALTGKHAVTCCPVTRLQDPQRRKVGHASFFGLQSGVSTLTASGTLCLLHSEQRGTTNHASQQSQSPHVHVICSGDALSPFLASAADLSPARATLCAGAEVDILVEAPAGSADEATWWSCSMEFMEDISGVDAAVGVLTQHSGDWELGWSKPLYPPPLMRVPDPTEVSVEDGPSVQTFGGGGAAARSSFQYTSGRRRSAGLVAVLKVLRPSSEVEADRARARPARPGTSPTPKVTRAANTCPWPAHYPSVTPSSFPFFDVHPWLGASSSVCRGASVSVFSSPYGLLSPHIFHNSLTRGIVSNCVRLDERERDGRRCVVVGQFGGGGVGNRFGSNERSSASALAEVPPSLLLIDTRCFAGSEGAPVLLTGDETCGNNTAVDAPAPLLAFVTLPIRHTQRGSAVELNLAIPAHRIQIALATRRLAVWTPSNNDNVAVTTTTTHAQHGRGEGWRIIENARRSLVATSASATSASSSSSSSPAVVPPSAPSPTRWSLLGMQNTANTRTRSWSSWRRSSPTGAASSHSNSSTAVAPAPIPVALAPVVTCAPAVRTLESTPTMRTVERAARSVLMARIGGSWASAIVLTADGCQPGNEDEGTTASRRTPAQSPLRSHC